MARVVIISGGLGKVGKDVRDLAKQLDAKDREIANFKRQIEELKQSTRKGNPIAVAVVSVRLSSRQSG